MRKCPSTGEFPLSGESIAGSYSTAVLLLHEGRKEWVGGGKIRRYREKD